MRLIRNRPAPPPSATNQPNFDRAEPRKAQPSPHAALPARGSTISHPVIFTKVPVRNAG